MNTAAPFPRLPIPIFTQSGDDRYEQRGQDDHQGRPGASPRVSSTTWKTKLGLQGEKLADYVAWLRERVLANTAGRELHARAAH